MKTKYLWVILAAVPTLVMAQKPKSKKEQDAVMAVQSAQTPDDKIAAVESLIQKFSDTEFKSWALNRAAESADRRKTRPKAKFYAEQALAADPKDYEAMLLLAAGIAAEHARVRSGQGRSTGESGQVRSRMPWRPFRAPTSRIAQVKDDQWDAFKKDMMAQAHESLGTAAMVRKKYDVAAQEYKTAIDTAADQEPATYVRLASAYTEGGKFDDSIATLDKVLAMPDLNPVVKQVAQGEKARAEKGKAAKK